MNRRAPAGPTCLLGEMGAALPAAIAAPFKPAPLFTDFCAQLGVELEPGQYVACAVAFDGAEPRDFTGAERELARELFGDIDVLSPAARRIVVAVCGARGGKTYVFGALRLLHLGLTVDISMLAPGEVASGPLIAPDMDLATQALRYVQGAVASHPGLAAMVVGKPDAAESIELSRDGRIVEIVVRSASGKGRTGRGRSLFGAVLEEAAFFRDKDHNVNDVEIFAAIPPRLLPGAQAIVSSTPWAQVGLLYDLFSANHPDPACAGIDERPRNEGTALALHAATRTLRTAAHILDIVTIEFRRDPDNAEREYGARFMSASAESFFDPLTITKCIDESIVMPLLPLPGDQVTSGSDLGFKKNSSALAVTHRRTITEKVPHVITGQMVDTPVNRIILADLREKRPQEGAALKPSAVIKEFADVIVSHHGSYLMGDGHYKETAIEHLGAAGLGFVEAPMTPAVAFIAARAAMREDRVRFANHPRFIRQMRETMSKVTSGGNLTIMLPRWKTGEHGDLVAAFVLAVYQAAGERVPAPKPTPGTPAAYAAEADAAREKRRDKVRQQYDRSSTASFVTKWPGRS